ncbi:hypothetical protein FQR65_LT16236 [Abscondita terminalis]|nr:hypothetical protein FQR65_LT16236 [Abscondita terminalis]
METVTDPLLNVLQEIPDVKELVCTSDKALAYTPLDYAVAAWSLSIANFLSRHNSTINAEIDHYRKDAYFAHCATLQYSSLFRVLLTYFSAREILFIRNTAEDTPVSQFFVSSNIRSSDRDKISLMMTKDIYDRPLLDLFKRRYLDERTDLPDYYYDLRFAAGFGTPEHVEYLLNKGADIDHQDIDKNTCLHYACINGRLENVRALLNNDAKVNLVNANNNSPLHYAIRRDHSEIAKLLLEYGANPNFQNRNKFTVLHFALTCPKKKDLVELMIRSGADSNIQNNKLNTALHYAARMGYDDVLLAMIRRGGDVNKTNYNNESPLFFALRAGHVGVASLLLKKGAGVHLRNKDRRTVLNIAAEFGYKDLVLEFLDRGADVNSVDVDHDTALNDALMHEHFDIAKVLLENGADGGICNKDGYCSLHYVAGADSDLLEEILKKVDINIRTATDDTALHLALSKNKVNNALELLRRGADVNVCNRDGNTPLHIAAFSGNSDIVSDILGKSIDCDKPNGFGDTPLHLALKKRHVDCANLLLARCDVNKTNEDGTALHYAVKKCCIEIVQFLIRSGCEIDVRNKSGMTPLHVAVTETLQDSNPIIKDCLLVIELLVKAGADVNSKDDREVRKKTCKQVAQMFIENGADIQIPNEEGESALGKLQHSGCTIS